MAQIRTAPDHKNKGWPSGVPYIIANEGCERFSYYGMRAILYIYVVGVYIALRDMDEASANRAATETTHLFMAAVYALPLIGAIISDKLLGKYKTIFYLSIVYCFGHLALAMFEDPTWQFNMFGKVFIDPIAGLYLGLGLIAVGSGGIKPCVSANVGDQFGRGNWHLLQKVFNAFYFIVNFGSAFATILIPLIRGNLTVHAETGHYYYDGSVGWAFGIPGILMGLATICFWAGRKKFVHVPPVNPGKLGVLDVLSGSSLFMVIGYPIFFGDMTSGFTSFLVSVGCFVLFIIIFTIRQNLQPDDSFLAQTFYTIKAKIAGSNPGEGEAPEAGTPDLRDHWFIGPAARKFGNKAAEGPIAVYQLLTVFLLVSVFWALFDQHSSTWIAQAKEMDRFISLSLSGWLFSGALLGFIIALAVVLTAAKTSSGRLTGIAIGVVAGLAGGFLVNNTLPAFEVQSSQVPAINPFLVMILIPYTTFGFYPLMDRLGYAPTPLRRMTIGMFLASLSFVFVAILQARLDAVAEIGGKVHVAWQVIPYVVITLSEVMVSITGLEFCYSQAPKKMKSVVMGFWLFTVTLGNLLVAFLAGFKDLPLVSFFWVFAALMAGAALIFGLRAKFYQYKEFTQ